MAVAQNMAHITDKVADAGPRSVRVSVEGQEGVLTVPLGFDEERAYAVVLIDGVRYHLERLTPQELVTEYRVDSDPDYKPQADTSGHCYFMVPFSQ